MRFATYLPMITLALLLGVSGAHAQTYTTGSTGTTGTTGSTNTTSSSGTVNGASTNTAPGTPNTGAGGDAAENAMILTGTGAVALLGASYLLRSRTR